MDEDVGDRFFVTISARGPAHLLELQRFGLDLFQATAREVDSERAVIEGLLDLEQVAELVREGYEVTVEDPMERRARAHLGTLTAEEWSHNGYNATTRSTCART